MENKKPVVFISSTIYDFKDIRSVMKYYLEEFGYEVLLSDYNDFPKPLDQNAFDACLTTLEKADYYILFIGSRVGSYYDAKNKISITQMEYRKAYDMARAGRLKCIFFVREELWLVKNDRKALQDYLIESYAKDKELSEVERNKIINHPSQFVTDANFIFNFIKEVSRDDETQIAATNDGLFPRPNWLHPFSTFREIFDALKNNLKISESLSRQALIVNLKYELSENLINLSSKWNQSVRPDYFWTKFIKSEITGGFTDETLLSYAHIQYLMVFLATLKNKLSSRYINDSLSSGYFLDYDKDKNMYIQSSLSECLFQLREKIEHVQMMTKGSEKLIGDLLSKYSGLTTSEKDKIIPNQDILVALSIANCQEDIVNLSVGIYKALEGDKSFNNFIKLNPISPLPLDAEKLRKEIVTREEIVEWLSNVKYTDL